MKLRLAILVAILASAFAFIDISAQNKPAAGGKKEVIPHAQTKPPGPALSPQEALKKMEVPPGFHVELVAAEPDIVNPVSMTFDERGRIWITESIEYPKRAAGPGKDRVKLLETTKGDGKFDKITTVIDGLNIPSGIAIGHGGVWVANAPDILYYPFEDFASAKLGKPQVVVTGFGRFDTHELPNSLTWGPDGWLYGLNGVFNRSVIKQGGKTFDFTCALFKIHPKTKKFEIFCEGTSNPWGLAFNENGDAFVSACVIDHLWHLTETGYYHRQGGPYPPFTWKIGSIVKHKHQKAAYCGLCWCDSDAYPPEYREKLYMGNIHGGCINADELTRDGSTYFAKPRPDFLTANDAWFMPVAQKVGPDGCMYILDWYDRYHCYQDANRDPAGIDRLHGRLYRVVYGNYKPAGKIELQKLGPANWTALLGHPNVYMRDQALRLLTTHLMDARTDSTQLLAEEQKKNTIERIRTRSMWALIGSGKIRDAVANELLNTDQGLLRTWGVRACADLGTIDGETRDRLIASARDASPDVQLQVTIAARKLKGVDAMPILLDVLIHCGDDKLIPHIVWQNLHPLLEKDGERFLTLAGKVDLAKAPGVAKVLPRAIDRILGNASGDPTAVVKFIGKIIAKKESETAARLCLASLRLKVQNGEIAGKPLENLKKDIMPILRAQTVFMPLFADSMLMMAALKDEEVLQHIRKQLDADLTEEERLTAIDVLTFAGDASIVAKVGASLGDGKISAQGRARMLSALARLNEPRVAEVVLAAYPKMDADLQPKSIELLTQRPIWAKSLFKDIAAKKISKDVVNVNQARQLLATKDKELAKLVEKHWGVPRDSRNPEREKIAAQMKELFKKTPGDPKAGAAHFKKICAQCHKMYGEGVDVGPDITSNGRADFDQLLSNIFDPSLVIGAGYQAVTVNTKQGQVISGLIVEDNAQRVVLKVQGGEVKTIARADVEEQFTSKVSLMPEDLEKQLRPQEIVDLLAYLSLDRPPEDAKARKIPGTPR